MKISQAFNEAPDAREPNLPKWAQHQLNRLRISARLANEALADHQASQTPTNIWYGDYDNPIYIPNTYETMTVHFATHGPDDPEDHMHDIQIRHTTSREYPEDHYLEISGGDSLVIEPVVSNLIRIRTKR
jgi:hypothetical protein